MFFRFSFVDSSLEIVAFCCLYDVCGVFLLVAWDGKVLFREVSLSVVWDKNIFWEVALLVV